MYFIEKAIYREKNSVLACFTLKGLKLKTFMSKTQVFEVLYWPNSCFQEAEDKRNYRLEKEQKTVHDLWSPASLYKQKWTEPGNKVYYTFILINHISINRCLNFPNFWYIHISYICIFSWLKRTEPINPSTRFEKEIEVQKKLFISKCKIHFLSLLFLLWTTVKSFLNTICEVCAIASLSWWI